MRAQILNRKVHYWLSAFVALPFLVVGVTGLLLQVKKQVPWVQPVEHRGAGEAPVVAWPVLLDTLRTIPEAGIASWADVDRVDVRPGKGLLKVVAANRWEVQVDAGTGRVLGVAYRRSDLLESLHDGSFFGDAVRWGWFAPSGLAFVVLTLTGVVLFWLPFGVKRRRKRAAPPPVRARPPVLPPVAERAG